MTTLYPALGRVIDEVVELAYPNGLDTPDDAAAMEQMYIEQQAIAKRAQELVDELGKLAMGSGTSRYLQTAPAIQHRTILGQIAKSIGAAVYGTTNPFRGCPGNDIEPGGHFIHKHHDGRLTCSTVVGAYFMSNQPLI